MISGDFFIQQFGQADAPGARLDTKDMQQATTAEHRVARFDCRGGLGLDRKDRWGTERAPTREEITERLARPKPGRLFFIRYALKAGFTPEEINNLSGIDPWFIDEIGQLVAFEERLEQVLGVPHPQTGSDVGQRAG